MNIRLDDAQNININDNAKVTYTKPEVAKNTVAFGAAYGRESGNKNVIGAYKDKKSAEDVMLEAGNIDMKNTKDFMTVMSNSLSDEDYKKLSNDGYDVGELEPWETVTIVDEIKATMAKGGTVIEGYNDDLDADKLTAMTGSRAYANRIADASVNEEMPKELNESFAKYDVPLTEKNISDGKAALDMAKELEAPNSGAVSYMVSNDMAPTIVNLYTAEHAGTVGITQGSTGYFADANGYLGYKAEGTEEGLSDQVSKVIEAAGFDATDDIIKDTLELVKEGVPVTKEAVETLEEIKNIDISDTSVSDAIARAIKLGRNAKDANLSKNARILEETRLHMTIEVRATMEKMGLSVDTDRLTRLVEDLKEAENRQFESLFGETFGIVETDSETPLLDLFNETNETVSAVKEAPIATVGIMALRASYTIADVRVVGQQTIEAAGEGYEKIGDLTYRNNVEIARMRYEEGATEVRSDLGDKITTAFRNAAELLNELGIEASEDNLRGVRILGYNQMEITESNLSKVNDAYNRITNVIDKMKPARVLDLIRKGYNPLSMNLEDLEEQLDSKELTPKEETERYANYLYRMEKSKSITEEERQAFVGIYKLVNSIEKQDGAAIGTLINMQGEINFKNLLSAVRTRRDKGIDLKIDNEFGALSEVIRRSSAIDEVINSAFEMQKPEMEIVDEEVVQLLAEHEVPANNNNLQAANGLLHNRGNSFKKSKEIAEKSTFVDKNVDNDSFIDELFNDITEAFDNEVNAKEAYEEMASKVESVLSEEALEEGKSIDVREIAASLKEIHVARNLSRQEWYEVPMELDGEVTSVSVKIRRGNTKEVGIFTELEDLGKIGGRFTLNNDVLDGLVMCDTREGFKLLNEKKEALENSLSMEGITLKLNFAESRTVSLNYLTNMSDIYNNRNTSQGSDEEVGTDAITTKTLYNTAKAFLGWLKMS